jgi:membrane protein
MPSAAEEVIDQALDEPGGTAFGIIGSLLVLISATSLSRAPPGRWRPSGSCPGRNTPQQCVALDGVVIALALSVVVARVLGRHADGLPPRNTWTLAVTILVMAFVPGCCSPATCRSADLSPSLIWPGSTSCRCSSWRSQSSETSSPRTSGRPFLRHKATNEGGGEDATISLSVSAA